HMAAVKAQLAAAKEAGITDVLAENLGAVELAKEFGFMVHGGMFLNVLNSEALQQYRNMGLADVTLSFELAFAESRGLAAPDTGFVTYGYLPLMKFRSCPAQGKNGCGCCSGLNELVDRKGERFPIVCREKQYSELLNCVPMYVGDRRRPEAGFETLYFTIEDRDQCRQVYETYLAGAPADFRRTAGLYFREVL
ncbi:MAG: U32 family peptidase, partial [Lachnospiraceae bacterium]|nr:U32 family peptidase [Lachnospiraceae bacterium]